MKEVLCSLPLAVLSLPHLQEIPVFILRNEFIELD